MSYLTEVRHSSPRYICAVLLLIACAAPALAGDVTLAWNPNSESDLAGYKIYYGTAPRVYGSPIIIGTQTTYTLTGLPVGTYYFAVTAYNTSGLESGYSNEVSTAVASNPATSRCDINGDSLANALDLQMLVNAVLGIQTLIGKGDLNGDGRIDVLDLQILGIVILGIRSCPL
jgi:hypothetical protein